MRFSNRWRIEGLLITKTPCHIGNGNTTTHDNLLKDKDKPDDKVDITAVARDVDGLSYIPGTSIKGNIRSWFRNRGCNDPITEELFGSEEVDGENAVGGKAEFWNAYALRDQNISCDSPYWRLERLTDVTVSVSIDRRKKTAIDQKLFHQEFVPPGVKFGMIINIPDAEEDEIAHLLYALEYGFSDEDPIVMGAFTGNGWGRFGWKLESISRMDSEDVRNWIESSAPSTGWYATGQLTEEERQELFNKVNGIDLATSDTLLRVPLKLKFKGPFLVNDPGRVNDGAADHTPRRNHQGKLVLPAESFRGAFRSQAERIIRTLEGSACDPDDPCKAIQSGEEVKERCLACQVFGASGWKSPVSFTDFVQCGAEKPEKKQEFVAIDRFTGGGAEHLKFNAKAVYSPVLEGVITIDTDKRELWEYGLLALTFRDLVEGDITFGFGAAKGYGVCEAEITDIPISEEKIKAGVKEFRKVVVERRETNYA